MTKKKVLTMVTALGLVGAVGVGGTLAWLTASTDPVTNTFAIGPGYIRTDESIKLDIRENLVKRDPATGAYTVMADMTTSDGQSYNSETKTYTYTKYTTEADAGTDSGVEEESGSEGIDYQGVVPGSYIPKNPHVQIGGYAGAGEITTDDNSIVNSRVIVKVTGLDEMTDIEWDADSDLGTGTVPPATIEGLGGNGAWIKVMNIDGTVAVDDTTDVSSVDNKKDGFYLYVGRHAEKDLDVPNAINELMKNSVVLSETVGTNGVVTENLFTGIQIDPLLTEGHLETPELLSDITVEAAIIQADNIATMKVLLTQATALF